MSSEPERLPESTTSPDQGRSGAVDRRSAAARIGTGIVAVAVVAPVAMSVRSLVPNALYEAPRRFKVGRPDHFPAGPTFLPDHRVFVFRDQNTFHCIGASCTHLGCTVQLARLSSPGRGETIEFHCPCHGSKFRADGSNYAGPAPSPLDYYRVELAPDDGQLIIDMSQAADKGWRFTV